MREIKIALLDEITSVNELKDLRDLYLQHWPQYCVGFYCLDNYLKWIIKYGNLKNLHIYTSRSEKGLFVIIDRYYLFVSVLNEDSCAILTEALLSLDWSKGFRVCSVLERHRPAIMDTVNIKGLSLKYEKLTVMYYLPNAEAKKFNVSCPKGFIFKPLCSETDAETIDSLWPNRHRGSLFLIKRLINWNINMGIYNEATNELVAWCLRAQSGFLGALQVKDKYKRLGLGAAVTSATSRCIADQGHDVMALVKIDNVPSRRMFEKLNFKVTDRCFGVETCATIENYLRPEDE